MHHAIYNIPWSFYNSYFHVLPNFFRFVDLTGWNCSIMPVNKSPLRVYLLGRCHITVIYQKCVFFTNIGNNYSLQNFDMLMIPVAIKSLLYLTWFWELVKPAETLTGSKSTCPTVFHLPFLLHNNNSVTINKLKKWITIPVCFRNGNISYTSLEF